MDVASYSLVVALAFALIVGPVLAIVILAKVVGLSRELADVKRLLAAHEAPKEPCTFYPDLRNNKVELRNFAAAQSEAEAKAAVVAQGEGVAEPARVAKPEAVASEIARPDVAPPLRLSPPQHPAAPRPPDAEPTAAEVFWSKVEDWFCVRGSFAPAGTTREFAVATRWLLRIGALLLVGAMAYFVTLAISRGWIGPTQRVCGMVFWGVVGTAFGAWLKARNGRYAPLGEIAAALGLVALYLGVGLGHRYFTPPVIASRGVAFLGLAATTLAAAALSIRLRSPCVAVLGLAGGFLVPAICGFSTDHAQLSAYLLVLVAGAAFVSCRRNWTPLAFAAIAVSYALALARTGTYPSRALADPRIGYAFHLAQYALVLALAARSGGGRSAVAWRWAFAALAAPLWSFGALAQGTLFAPTATCTELHFAFAAVAHGALAVASRRRRRNATPVLLVLSALFALAFLVTLCQDSAAAANLAAVVFCAFAALAAELSVRAKERALGVLALLVFALCLACGFGAMQDVYGKMGAYWPGFVDRALDFWCIPALGAFLAMRLGKTAGWPAVLRPLLAWASAGFAFLIVTDESRWFGALEWPAVGAGTVTMVWAALASALLAAGIFRRLRVLRLSGLALLGLSVGKILFVDTASLATPARVAVFAAVGVLMIAGAFLYLKSKSAFEEMRRGEEQ